MKNFFLKEFWKKRGKIVTIMIFLGIRVDYKDIALRQAQLPLHQSTMRGGVSGAELHKASALGTGHLIYKAWAPTTNIQPPR